MTNNNSEKAALARERIRAITGDPLAREAAVRPHEELVKRLHEDSMARLSIRKEKKKAAFPFIRKLIEVTGKEEPEAIWNLPVKTHVLQTTPRATERRRIESAILLGSVEAVFTPPYDFEWTQGFGGDFGDWNTKSAPTSKQQMLADKSTGDIKLHNRVVLEDFNSVYAGLAVFYRPLTSGFKRFRFGVEWEFSWVDDSSLLTANNTAYVRITVYEYNLDGSNFTTIVNQQFQQWSDGTGWYETHSDSGSGLSGGFESIPFPASPDKAYTLWAWCSCEVQSDDENVAGFLPVGSFADAALAMHIPAMSIKEA